VEGKVPNLQEFAGCRMWEKTTYLAKPQRRKAARSGETHLNTHLEAHLFCFLCVVAPWRE